MMQCLHLDPPPQTVCLAALGAVSDLESNVFKVLRLNLESWLHCCKTLLPLLSLSELSEQDPQTTSMTPPPRTPTNPSPVACNSALAAYEV